MKVTHFMFIVSAVIVTWLTASYLIPVPSASYEHASSFMTAESPASHAPEQFASAE